MVGTEERDAQRGHGHLHGTRVLLHRGAPEYRSLGRLWGSGFFPNGWDGSWMHGCWAPENRFRSAANHRHVLFFSRWSLVWLFLYQGSKVDLSLAIQTAGPKWVMSHIFSTCSRLLSDFFDASFSGTLWNCCCCCCFLFLPSLTSRGPVGSPVLGTATRFLHPGPVQASRAGT